jgi:SanA protein
MKKPYHFKFKTFLKGAVCACLAVAAAVAAVNVWIDIKTRDFVYDDVSALPQNKTGLLLGTSPFRRGGKPNPFFEDRIAAAVELYDQGKIRNIIVSGDNRALNYNEPEEMRRQLVKRGVPPDRIYLDYAGRRTLDSVVRCGEIFGQVGFTVISQRFHNKRAVFLGRARGFDAIGFNADGAGYRVGFQTGFREYLARVGAILDLLTYRQPHFLGDKIEIKGE